MKNSLVLYVKEKSLLFRSNSNKLIESIFSIFENEKTIISNGT